MLRKAKPKWVVASEITETARLYARCVAVDDIGDGALVESLLARHRPRAVLNFAAESHVDRSIVDPEAFLLRLRDAISIDHFIVGIVKAPVMAAVIGIVACVEGLAVQGSAESLGQHTTSSVVKGIFFVIVMDGVFAIFFAAIGM